MLKKIYRLIKSRFIKLTPVQDWQDDLIMCPSQCYYYFTYKGRPYCIYLRWRHSDPWSAELIEDCTPSVHDSWDGKWNWLNVDSFTHDQLPLLKKQAIIEAKMFLAGCYEC